MIRHVLVVCVGNICRSPMAEALLRDAFRGKEEFIVESAGLGALVGYPAENHAVELLSEQGIDIKTHRARQLDAEMLKVADLILVMESEHKKAIDSMDPTARGKVYRLGEWREVEISDPYRQPKAAFAEALYDIQDGISDWVSRIQA